MTMAKLSALTRRNTLVLGLVASAAALLPSLPAFAAEPTADDMIKEFTKGAASEESGITLEVPEIAENGNTVPLRLSIDSPMTEGDHVKRVMVLAVGNPRPGVATFNFSPASGSAAASTRIRLAKTQDVVVVAELSTGKFLTAKKTVKVTIGGCGG
jgi:sulfur-oxidizing protein SoxY